MKKIIALVLIAAVAATSAITLTGCKMFVNSAAALPNNAPVAQTSVSANTSEPAAASAANVVYTDDETPAEYNDNRDFTIAVQNIDTGDTSSVLCSYADDRYDIVSGYFWLTEGSYNIAVYTYNPAGGNTSLCAVGSCLITASDLDESGQAPVRINYSPIMSDVDVEFQ